ncbi:hypothetical protein a10_05247 [Streptomyces acidiscabies]|nr:hypothetical protein a10_05247 [Streptomyces acidiscabies]
MTRQGTSTGLETAARPGTTDGHGDRQFDGVAPHGMETDLAGAATRGPKTHLDGAAAHGTGTRLAARPDASAHPGTPALANASRPTPALAGVSRPTPAVPTTLAASRPSPPFRLGTGIGWRPEIADAIERMPGVDWVEAVAENLCPGHLPESLQRLRARGVTVVPHGVSLGLGGAERPDAGRLAALAERVEALGSPLVTEHIAFVRAGGALTATAALEAGHLLPVPKTRDALDVLCENIRIAQDALPVPLAVENIAALLAWPGEEMTEGQFLYDLVDRTGVRLLIDVANLHTNHVNRGEDPAHALAELPVEAIAYVHVAGGLERDGVWHDTHAHPVPPVVLSLLTDLTSRTAPAGVLLERDDNFPDPAELTGELEAIREAVSRGALARTRTETLAAVRPTAMAGAGVRATAMAGTTAGARPASSTGTLPAPSAAAHPATLATTPPAASAATPLPEVRPTPPEEAPPTTRPTPTTPPAPAHALTDQPTTPPIHPEPTHLPATPARQRLALAQASLLSALVAGTPAPEGFDRARLAVQARALAAKRADVVAKVAPELPEILGAKYRPAFLAYASARPLRGGYRQDALEFAEHLLQEPESLPPHPRRALRSWWLDRSGPAPRNQSRLAKTVRALTGR